jgi:hypothetical protein
MALIIIAALCIVPLALLVWDLPRNADRRTAADETNANAGNAMSPSIHLHA